MKLGVSYVVVECMNVKADENDALAFTNVASSLSGYETAKWSTKLAEIRINFCFLQVFFMIRSVIYPPVNHLIQRERPQRLSLSTSLYFVIAANVPTLCKHILLLLRGAKLINLGLILDLHLKTMVSKKWMRMAAWWHSMMLGCLVPQPLRCSPQDDVLEKGIVLEFSR